MLRKDDGKRSKSKPRGRPFTKGHKQKKLGNDLLASSGHESSVEGGIITSNHQNAVVEENNPQKIDIEELSTPEDSSSSIQDKEKSKELELIDSLEFNNGENTLTIRFSRKHNRMFRIQVFLNDESEIRPVTYTGASTGYAFWNLLKGSLKK